VLHPLGRRPEPKDFTPDWAAKPDQLIGVSFRELHDAVTLHPAGFISPARKAACQLAPHHLFPVHDFLQGRSTCPCGTCLPGPSDGFRFGVRLVSFPPPTGGVPSNVPDAAGPSGDVQVHRLEKGIWRGMRTSASTGSVKQPEGGSTS